eukprot:364602-Chlamydomonas_euryale.AAC.9
MGVPPPPDETLTRCALLGAATVANGSGGALHLGRVARWSRALCRWSEARRQKRGPSRDRRATVAESATRPRPFSRTTHGLVGVAPAAQPPADALLPA